MARTIARWQAYFPFFCRGKVLILHTIYFLRMKLGGEGRMCSIASRSPPSSGRRTYFPSFCRGKVLILHTIYFLRMKLGGEGRIRTSEGIANRFTVCPLWPLGNLSDSKSSFLD